MFKNLFTTLRGFRVASLLNILGLGLAFAAFTLIMIQVVYEYGYGRSDGEHERIFRLETYSPLNDEYSTNTFPYVTEQMEGCSPLIESSAMILFQRDHITVVRPNGDEAKFANEWTNYLITDPSAVFDMEMAVGEIKSALEPGVAVISESQARRMFSGEDPIGQRLKIRGGEYTVQGVCRDMPQNATLHNAVYIKGHGQGPRVMFLKITDPTRLDELIETFRAKGENEQIRLTPIGDAYFADKMGSNDYIPSGNRATTNVLLTIAILVIVIAGVNFINFSTAMAPLRIRSLNTRLVLGDTVWGLRRGIIFEAVMLALLAYGLGMALAYQFIDTSLRSMIRVSDPTLGANLDVLLLCAAVALLVGLVAGIYPAYYNTRFEPALVLKGSFGSSQRGRSLRTSLVGFQYVISIGLIIGALYVRDQNRFMLSAPLGYDRDNLVKVHLPWEAFEEKERLWTIVERMRQVPGVQAVTTFNGSFGVTDCDIEGTGVISQGDTIGLRLYSVGPTFREAMGIPLIQGRDFSPEAWRISVFDDEQIPEVILNATAARRCGTAADSLIDTGRGRRMRVVGVTEDFISRSIADPIEPIGLVIDMNSVLLLRLPGDSREQTLANVKQALDEFQFREPYQIEPYEQQIKSLYDKEGAFGELITLFSMLAVAIALMGVFGLVLFETQYRRTEITLRKIHGATVWQVLGLFNGSFVRVVAICFVVAAPLSWIAVSQWLGGFTLQTPFQWWVFVVALVVVLVVTLITVTLQSWRTATENPVKSLRKN